MTVRLNKLEILAKIEASYGVDPTLSAAQDAVLAENVTITHPGDVIDRNGIGGTMTPLPHQIARSHSTIEFDVEFKGSGAVDTPPDWGPLIQACGFNEAINAAVSVVYTPISGNMPSLAIEYFIDAFKFQILGCRGNVAFDLTVGQRPMMRFSFIGKYQNPTNVVLPNGTYQATRPVPMKAIGLNIGAYAPVLASWRIDMQNDVQIADDVNAADGYGPVRVADRNPLGVIDPEWELVATYDFWDNWQQGTEQQIACQFGPGGGERIDIKAPKTVFREMNYGERGGFANLLIPHTLAGVAGVGDDELTITHD